MSLCMCMCIVHTTNWIVDVLPLQAEDTYKYEQMWCTLWIEQRKKMAKWCSGNEKRERVHLNSYVFCIIHLKWLWSSPNIYIISHTCTPKWTTYNLKSFRFVIRVEISFFFVGRKKNAKITITVHILVKTMMMTTTTMSGIATMMNTIATRQNSNEKEKWQKQKRKQNC